MYVLQGIYSTMRASVSSRELIVKPAFFAARKLTSIWTRLPCIIKLTIPPLSANPLKSLTVSTGKFSTVKRLLNVHFLND